ncbi:MAG: thioredoxin family protein [Candidatus Accumulibacter sp.]|jgi:thiol-disulfide isomerase/thioredoxin|nr:thioredoxin family protein [Accumulibacter sp.]
MKHIVIFLLLAAGIAFLATRKSDLDRVMEPTAVYGEDQVGIVEVAPGSMSLSPQTLAESGVISIIFFYEETCPASRQMDNNLHDFVQRFRPDVAVRKVNVADRERNLIREYPCLEQFVAYRTPCFLIFDKKKNLIAADDKTKDSSGSDFLLKWMNAEMRKAANRS